MMTRKILPALAAGLLFAIPAASLDSVEDAMCVCADGVLDMPPGGVVVAALIVAEPIPLESPDRSLIYSAVFDSDGDPANDWVFNDPFDWDYFQGADRWYQLAYSHTAGTWTLTVTQLDAGGAITGSIEPSTVRAVIEGDTIVFFISETEFAVDRPGYRLTTFGHDGAFSQDDRGGDVSGDLPSDPLTVLGGDRIPATP